MHIRTYAGGSGNSRFIRTSRAPSWYLLAKKWIGGHFTAFSWTGYIRSVEEIGGKEKTGETGMYVCMYVFLCVCVWVCVCMHVIICMTHHCNFRDFWRMKDRKDSDTQHTCQMIKKDALMCILARIHKHTHAHPLPCSMYLAHLPRAGNFKVSKHTNLTRSHTTVADVYWGCGQNFKRRLDSSWFGQSGSHRQGKELLLHIQENAVKGGGLRSGM